MISSRRLAQQLINLTKQGHDPRVLIHSLATSSSREIVSLLPKVLEYTELYAQQQKRQSEDRLVVASQDDAPEFRGTVITDPSRIGGAVVSRNGKVYDSSLSTRISSLSQQLSH